MRDTVREAVRQRFALRCGYCGVHEDETGARLTLDHFQPTSQGGTDDEDNLVYACYTCNIFKGDYWDTSAAHGLLHPLRDDLTLHFVQSIAHLLVPLTPRGALYIATMHLNRPELVNYRRLQYNAANLAPILTELMQRFGSLEAEVKRLQGTLD